MGDNTGKKNPFARFFRMLVENRWFFACTASMCATIIGISLTFGINSCRESRKTRKEMQKSMLQAVDNLNERLEEVEEWVHILEKQNSVYNLTDSLYIAGVEIPDSLYEEFRYTLPYVRISGFDHDFEKIFRGSYQLWQVQNQNDKLSFYITQCYDGVNLIEQTCVELTESMLEKIGEINDSKGIARMSPREWTMVLLEDPRFQYYMSIRNVKTNVAAEILSQVQTDYKDNVIPDSEKLK